MEFSVEPIDLFFNRSGAFELLRCEIKYAHGEHYSTRDDRNQVVAFGDLMAKVVFRQWVCSDIVINREINQMKKALCVAVLGSLLTIPLGYGNAQERPRESRPPMSMPMPGGPMGEMMGHEHMEMMLELIKDNPKAAGIMMQMHGDMMRIRGDELTKMGEVMKRYGERLEKESGR